MVQNAPLASGTRDGFSTLLLLSGPEEAEREEALQLKRMELPGGNREGKRGKKHHGRRQWLGKKQDKSGKCVQRGVLEGKVREE